LLVRAFSEEKLGRLLKLSNQTAWVKVKNELVPTTVADGHQVGGVVTPLFLDQVARDVNY
jgi:hypothetical protein